MSPFYNPDSTDSLEELLTKAIIVNTVNKEQLASASNECEEFMTRMATSTESTIPFTSPERKDCL